MNKQKAVMIVEKNIRPSTFYPTLTFFCPYCDFSYTVKVSDVDRLFNMAIDHLFKHHWDKLEGEK